MAQVNFSGGKLPTTIRRTLAQVVALALAIACAVALASPSDAAKKRKWNSKSTPLTLKDGDVLKAQGYGKWTIGTTSSGTRSQAWGYLRDRHANGFNVFYRLDTYTNAGYCLSPEYVSCDQVWYPWKH